MVLVRSYRDDSFLQVSRGDDRWVDLDAQGRALDGKCACLCRF